MTEPLKVGDKYPTWFSDMPDGMSTILEIRPYHSFREENRKMFSLVLKVTAPRTRRGWMKLCV